MDHRCVLFFVRRRGACPTGSGRSKHVEVHWSYKSRCLWRQRRRLDPNEQFIIPDSIRLPLFCISKSFLCFLCLVSTSKLLTMATDCLVYAENPMPDCFHAYFCATLTCPVHRRFASALATAENVVQYEHLYMRFSVFATRSLDRYDCQPSKTNTNQPQQHMHTADRKRGKHHFERVTE